MTNRTPKPLLARVLLAMLAQPITWLWILVVALLTIKLGQEIGFLIRGHALDIR